MTNELLSRLERIDHKEYNNGFEFADSSTFDEMARCFEDRKILAKEIERLQDMDKILRNENINLKLRINKARELREQLSYQYYENGFEYDTPMLLKDLDKILDNVDKVGETDVKD